MAFLDKLFGKRDSVKITEPIFLKEYDRDSNVQLKQLNELLEKVGDDQKELIEAEIKKIQSGLTGEQNVSYQLKMSFLPIICLHNVRIEYKDYTAQYDFIVITKKGIIVLETKALLHDIIIDNYGNFIRVFKDYKGNVYKKEGMESPVSQNEKHIDVLNAFLRENNLGKNLPIFSLVVIANPKSIIDMKYAQREVKDIIIKHDQLKRKIQELCDSVQGINVSEQTMYELGEFILANDKPIEYDYIKKLRLKVDEKQAETVIKEKKENEEIKKDETSQPSLNDALYEELKKYRAKKAKEKGLKELYFIFNNKELSNLVLNRPMSKEEFLQVPGFGEKKYYEYGEDIITIIKNNSPDANITNSNPVSSTEQAESSNQELANTPLYKDLRSYRFKKAQEQNIKPNFIFNNEQLEALCTSKPSGKEQFVTIKGFDEKKYLEYGEDILTIVKNNGTDTKLTNSNSVLTLEQTEEKESSNQEIANTPLYKDLRSYRFKKAQEENLKPYFIFNNEQLESLCLNKPSSKEQFIALNGFGEKKYEKYGEEILDIIKKYN